MQSCPGPGTAASASDNLGRRRHGEGEVNPSSCKICSICSESKPETAFSKKQWVSKDARSRKCEQCRRNHSASRSRTFSAPGCAAVAPAMRQKPGKRQRQRQKEDRMWSECDDTAPEQPAAVSLDALVAGRLGFQAPHGTPSLMELLDSANFWGGGSEQAEEITEQEESILLPGQHPHSDKVMLGGEQRMQQSVKQLLWAKRAADYEAARLRTAISLHRLADQTGQEHGRADALLEDSLNMLQRKTDACEGIAAAHELQTLKVLFNMKERALHDTQRRVLLLEAELEAERARARWLPVTTVGSEAGSSLMNEERRWHGERVSVGPGDVHQHRHTAELAPIPGANARPQSKTLLSDNGRQRDVDGEVHRVETEAWQVIEGIRREKLVGVEVPEHLSKAIEQMRCALGRAVDRLAQDLYSSSAHFLDEIIQNCDDNVYSHDVVPALELLVLPKPDGGGQDIWVLNNEVGFHSKDVVAICDVCNSSKRSTGAEEDGSARSQIGKKGIGFKSVFMVTEAPHIVSGGFAFKFDRAKNGNFGLVVPEWLQDWHIDQLFSRYPPPLLNCTRSGCALWPEGPMVPSWSVPTLTPPRSAGRVAGGTAMFLPGSAASSIAHGAGSGNPAPCAIDPTGCISGGVIPEDLTARLDPVVLLVLRQLQVVIVEDRCRCRRRALRRNDTSGNAAGFNRQVNSTGGERVWLSSGAIEEVVVDLDIGNEADWLVHGASSCHQHNYFLAKMCVYGAMGKPEGTSEVLLAFPTDQDGEAGRGTCGVYAFLPVYTAGLRFVVQADFELVASRQQLRHDSDWNLRLRDAVARLFVAAMTCGGLGGHAGNAALALQSYLPREKEITCPFWKPLRAQMLEFLQGENCILTESGRLRKPSEVYIRCPQISASMLSNDDLVAATGCEFALRGERGEGSSETEDAEELLRLGCRMFTATVLLQCLESEAMQVFSFLGTQMLGESGVLSLGAAQPWEQDLLARLFCLPVFRVRCDTKSVGSMGRVEMVALNNTRVFLSLPSGLSSALSSGALRLMCDSFGCLLAGEDPESVPDRQSFDLLVPDSAKRLLECLGVVVGSAETIYEAILEQHWAGSFVSVDQVWAGLKFVKEHLPGILRRRVADERQGQQAAAGGAGKMDDKRRRREPLYMRGIGEPAETLREARAALCLPASSGLLRSASQLAVRSILGVECPKCFSVSCRSKTSSTQADEAPSAPTSLPLRLVALMENDDGRCCQHGKQSRVEVLTTSFFSRARSGGTSVHTHKICVLHAEGVVEGGAQADREDLRQKPVRAGETPRNESVTDQRGLAFGAERHRGARTGTPWAKCLCVSSAGSSRGCFRFDVIISTRDLQYLSVGLVSRPPQPLLAEKEESFSIKREAFFGIASNGVVHRGFYRQRNGSGGAFDAGDMVTCIVDLDQSLVVYLVNGQPCVPTPAAFFKKRNVSNSQENMTADHVVAASNESARAQLRSILGLVETGDGAIGEEERQQIEGLAKAAVRLPADFTGAEVLPAVTLAPAGFRGAVFLNFSTQAYSKADEAEGVAQSSGGNREGGRKCVCESPWCGACGLNGQRREQLDQVEAMIMNWGRGASGGGNGVAGLAELRARQMKGVSCCGDEGIETLGDAYRSLDRLDAGQKLRDLEVSEWSVEQERAWEGFFVGLLGVWPHLNMCGHQHWWSVSCRGAAGECAICKDALASDAALAPLPLMLPQEESTADADREGARKWVAPVILTCLHVFHAACIEEWFRRRARAGREPCCPVCRLASSFESIKQLTKEDAAQELAASLSQAIGALNENESVRDPLQAACYVDYLLLQSYSSTNFFHTRELLKSAPLAAFGTGRGGGGRGCAALEDMFAALPFQRFCGDLLPYLPVRGTGGWLSQMLRRYGVAIDLDSYEDVLKAIRSICRFLESRGRRLGDFSGGKEGHVDGVSQARIADAFTALYSSLYACLLACEMRVCGPEEGSGTERVHVRACTVSEVGKDSSQDKATEPMACERVLEARGVFSNEKLIFTGGRTRTVEGMQHAAVSRDRCNVTAGYPLLLSVDQCVWEDGSVAAATCGLWSMRNSFGSLRPLFVSLFQVPRVSVALGLRALCVLSSTPWPLVYDRLVAAQREAWGGWEVSASFIDAAHAVKREIEGLLSECPEVGDLRISAKDVKLLACDRRRRDAETLLVSAHDTAVYLDDDADIVLRLQSSTVANPRGLVEGTGSTKVWVAHHRWIAACPSLARTLVEQGLLRSLRSSTAFGSPNIHRSLDEVREGKTGMRADVEIEEESLQILVRRFVRLCCHRVVPGCSKDQTENSALEEIMGRMVGLVRETNIRALLMALGYVCEGEVDWQTKLEQRLARLKVVSVTKITRRLVLRNHGTRTMPDDAPQTATSPTIAVREAEEKHCSCENDPEEECGQSRPPHGGRTQVLACMACGVEACNCLALDDHLDWALQHADRKRHQGCSLCLYLSREGARAQNSADLYDDLAPMGLRALDVVVHALSSLLTAENVMTATNVEGQRGQRGAGGNIKDANHIVWANACGGVSCQRQIESQIPDVFSAHGNHPWSQGFSASNSLPEAEEGETVATEHEHVRLQGLIHEVMSNLHTQQQAPGGEVGPARAGRHTGTASTASAALDTTTPLIARHAPASADGRPEERMAVCGDQEPKTGQAGVAAEHEAGVKGSNMPRNAGAKEQEDGEDDAISVPLSLSQDLATLPAVPPCLLHARCGPNTGGAETAGDGLDVPKGIWQGAVAQERALHSVRQLLTAEPLGCTVAPTRDRRLSVLEVHDSKGNFGDLIRQLLGVDWRGRQARKGRRWMVVVKGCPQDEWERDFVLTHEEVSVLRAFVSMATDDVDEEEEATCIIFVAGCRRNASPRLSHVVCRVLEVLDGREIALPRQGVAGATDTGQEGDEEERRDAMRLRLNVEAASYRLTWSSCHEA